MQDVLSGKVLACQIVKNAVLRHQRDLQEAAEGKSTYVFNPAYPMHVIQFFEQLKHYKGEYAGKPFILEPWQQFVIWVVFGWRKGTANGPRRFRNVYIEIPKKNGKTSWAAGIMLYMAFFDNESAADVYSAATKRDQAKISWLDAKNYVKRNSQLARHITITQTALSNSETESRIMPLSNDQDTSDGINVHCAVIDELHRHKNSEMVDLLEASISARRQPLIWEITTAGSNKQSVCYEHHRYTEDVNSGKVTDPTWFGLIYTLDSGDDWRDPEMWQKANPNLGTGKSVAYLEDRVNKARQRARLENSVKRYEFNIWTGAEEKWIPQETWEAGNEPKSDAELLAPGVVCYGGLDLASKRDFNALALLFVNEEEGWKYQKHFYWCPKDAIDKRVENENTGFLQWVNDGWLKLVPGNVVDPETLGGDIIAVCEKWKVKAIAYDPYIATHGTVQRLIKAGIDAFEIGQSYRVLSEPTKLLEAEIYNGKATHEGNPVTGWMMENVVVYTDPNENIKLKKEKPDSPNKIDGPVASVMAYAEWLDDSLKDQPNYDDLDIILV